MSLAILAPGKAMLIGEYAVLDGSSAVVAAVNRYAVAQLHENASPASDFIRAALEQARIELLSLGPSAPSAVPVVDTTAFAPNGRKLGLGSSAAATVAALGALFVAAGRDLLPAAHLIALHRAARRAHDIAQGEPGSGADVLASTFGGLRALENRGAALDHCPDELQLPAPLQLRFIATGRSASTAALIKRYRSVGAAADSGRARMGQAAKRFLQACRMAAPGEILEAVAEAQSAFRVLQEALNCELLTAEHMAIADLAKQVGGVAKPSGAGGGDLAVVFLPDLKAAAALEQRLVANSSPVYAELELLPLQISLAGCHVGGFPR